MKKILFILSLLLFSAISFSKSYAQTTKPRRDLVQVSGMVLRSDSLQPVFYTKIVNRTTRQMTLSNAQGFFSLVAEKGDTLVFSAVGYQKDRLAIPKDLENDHFSVIQFLAEDTILLNTVVIRPYPAPHEFKHAFVHTEIPNDDYQRAAENLKQETLAILAENMPAGGSENFNYHMQNYSQKLYFNGQYPPMQIFNPIAWVQFFKALKRGDFKSKSKKKSR